MKIGEVGHEKEILDPDVFNITPFKIEKTDRAASGRLIKEIIAIKNRYTLSYKALEPSDMDIFISLYENGDIINFIYEDSEKTRNVFVNIEEIPRDLYIYGWKYSQNVTIVLEEA